jgi:multidrug resistance protein, MATE family
MERRPASFLFEARATLSLAAPIMAGLVGHMLMGLADTLMIGRVGTRELAAAAFANNIFHMPLVGAFGLLTAVAVLSAHAYGASRPDRAGEVLRHGLSLALFSGLIAALVLWAGRAHLGFLRQPPEVVEAARTYLTLLGWSLVPLLGAHALKQFSEALNRPWIPMLILLGGVLLNIFLNWLLIYGNWGLPALGLDGAGVATLIARVATAAGMVAYLFSSAALRPFLPQRWLARFSWPFFREQLNLGSPVAVQHVLEVGAFATAALMMGWISAEAMAAHQIAITCAATTFMFSLGIGMAVSIRVGHAWGAGERERLRKVVHSGLGMTTVLMSGFALLFFLGATPIATAFTPSSEVIKLAAGMLLVAALFQVFDGLQVVALSALRGMADVKVPALTAVVSYWIVALPLAGLAGFIFGGGPIGIWFGLAAGLACAAGALIWRFERQSREAGARAESAGSCRESTAPFPVEPVHLGSPERS